MKTLKNSILESMGSVEIYPSLTDNNDIDNKLISLCDGFVRTKSEEDLQKLFDYIFDSKAIAGTVEVDRKEYLAHQNYKQSCAALVAIKEPNFGENGSLNTIWINKSQGNTGSIKIFGLAEGSEWNDLEDPWGNKDPRPEPSAYFLDSNVKGETTRVNKRLLKFLFVNSQTIDKLFSTFETIAK